MDRSIRERDSAPHHVPKQARAQERAAKILEAARAELEIHSPAEVRTEDIAARAQVPVGSIYHYFANKNALLAAVVEQVVAEADAAVSGLLADCLEMPWDDAVDLVLTATFDFYMREDNHYRVLLRSIRHTEEFAEITADSNDRIAEVFSQHPAFARAGVAPEQAHFVSRILVTASNALQDRILVDDKIDLELWQQETALLAKQYISAYVPYSKKLA